MRERIARILSGLFLFCLWVLIFLLVAVRPSQAQTTPPATPAPSVVNVQDLLDGGYSFAMYGGFSATSGATTKNGPTLGFEKQIKKHAYVRLDQWGVNDLAGSTLSFMQAQAKYSLAHLIKPTVFFNSKPILLSVHAGPGILKSPAGAVHFAAAAGVSVDYSTGKGTFIRMIEFTHAYSRGLANNGLNLGNYNSITTGFGWQF